MQELGFTVVSDKKDKGFWRPGESEYMINEDSFFNNSSSMEYKRTSQWLYEFDSYVLHTKKQQAVEAPITSQKSRINMPNLPLPLENSSIFRSLPNRITNSSIVENNVISDQFENSYGGLEQMKGGWVKDPKSGWCTYVGSTFGSGKTFIPIEQPRGKEGGDASVGLVGFNAQNFGSYEEVMDALSRPVSSYTLLYEQSSLLTPKTPTKKVRNGLVRVSPSQRPKWRQESTNKIKSDKKPAKKVAENGFLTNVKSLIATGMLDGVPVRYVSTSQEDLHAIIKGVGYLCGCQSCNYTKALNAYELERHAGCKTSHPNNHIHFENGKSIHQVVQELKATPQTMLFDAIQTVTGAPINQSSLRGASKESLGAATSEVQHIHIEKDPNLSQMQNLVSM